MFLASTWPLNHHKLYHYHIRTSRLETVPPLACYGLLQNFPIQSAKLTADPWAQRQSYMSCTYRAKSWAETQCATFETNPDNAESLGSDMIWSSSPSHFIRHDTCNLHDWASVSVIWIPKRLRLTGFCYVELLQRLLQQKFLLRPQRSSFCQTTSKLKQHITILYTVSDPSSDCLNTLHNLRIIMDHWSFIQNSKLSGVLFNRTRDLDPRPQAAEPLPSPTCPGEL